MKKKKVFYIKKNKSKKIRNKINNINLNRLTIYKTYKHIYAQLLSKDKKFILTSASTNEKYIKKILKKKNIYTGNKKSSELVGEIIAKRILKIGIKKIYFDRSRFKFHGRIKSLADKARFYGLKF